VDRSAAIGEAMRARMLVWQQRWPVISDVRGLGSMLAIELADMDGRSGSETASRIVEEALTRGLLLLKAGVTGNSIRVLVPLVVSDVELEEALGAWEGALAATL
jgi:4-aminobutyrate aminotransferase-like enzyme